ncbi:hypothetical protein TNIN_130761 [Trichonephila inaurata madagascariensis]|uniref:Uncharacterized protein n=1 Tax=Trichonephila inaurata madagascariensis TaxID=2747483 RepID=A0A8X6XU96_9ARAC|nr:hypothetical protein TNIN_130761 [Trichonephila inaurata madagascariensis]
MSPRFCGVRISPPQDLRVPMNNSKETPFPVAILRLAALGFLLQKGAFGNEDNLISEENIEWERFVGAENRMGYYFTNYLRD